MQCQNCSQHTATIHLTEISNGQRVETHLCEECAQKQGLAVKSQIPLNELLSTLLAVQSGAPSGPVVDASAGKACPRCGITLQQFQKTSLLGCPDDYEVFEKQLLPIIQKAHNGNVAHLGKIPSRSPQDTKNQIELIDLQRQLEAAVKNENYETAAMLRDQIEQLK